MPESHVPEKARETLAGIIEAENMGGQAFAQYVMHVPPEVCAPKNAMKLKAAWKNVMAEQEMKEVARTNHELNQAQQKATMIVC